MPSEAEQLAEEIKQLAPPDKLRLAASLLEAKRPEIAYTIAEGVVLELGAALALARLKQRG